MEQRALIQSQSFLPDERLQQFVSAYLLTTIDATGGNGIVDLFPVSYPVLSFAIDDLPLVFEGTRPVLSKFTLTGQLTRHCKLTVNGSYYYAYILFKPWGAYRLLGFPQHLLANDFKDVRELAPYPETGRAYGQLLAIEEGHEQVIELFEEWLLSMLERHGYLSSTELTEKACNLIMEANGSLPVTSLCKQLFVSKTKLERLFRLQVGMSPKMFSRVIRFNHAYQTILKKDYNDWQDLIVRYRYFDQAHFIKEFRTFCGYTPSQLYQSELNIARHVQTIEE